MEEYGILFREDKQMYFAGFKDHGAFVWVDHKDDAIWLAVSMLEKAQKVLKLMGDIDTKIMELQ